MMRSMYSAVSGLKTHQTKMDVIGNNIANVNTVAFKGSSVTFQDILYQTTSGASGANAATGVGGINAKQIGLGVTTGATNVNITSAGAAETTGNPFDIRLSDKSTTNFFVVNNGSENVFTRSGSFYVDGTGNLCMTSTGYTVMGWQVDPATGQIRKDTVSALRIMQTDNLSSPPEATTMGIFSGILDKNDSNASSDTGLVKSLTFYDNLGYQYTAKFAVKAVHGVDGEYTVELDSILNTATNETIFSADTATTAQMTALFGTAKTSMLGTYEDLKTGFSYVHDGTTPANSKLNYGSVELTFGQLPGGGFGFTGLDTSTNPATPVQFTYSEVFDVSAGMQDKVTAGTATPAYDPATGKISFTGPTIDYPLTFSNADGTFGSINGGNAVNLNMSALGANFQNISIDFSGLKNQNNGGKTTAAMDSGAKDGTTGKGKKLGALIELSVDVDGKIFGSYDNGNSTLLGQIAVAQFSNAAGLEKTGDNCYKTTLNSGEFDGIGVEVSADGSSMTTGELEMSNVDLSSEFTAMIVTQRGFQANSRVITTSDTLLEELVNLKR